MYQLCRHCYLLVNYFHAVPVGIFLMPVPGALVIVGAQIIVVLVGDVVIVLSFVIVGIGALCAWWP